jgi:hypothetical protein
MVFGLLELTKLTLDSGINVTPGINIANFYLAKILSVVLKIGIPHTIK